MHELLTQAHKELPTPAHCFQPHQPASPDEEESAETHGATETAEGMRGRAGCGGVDVVVLPELFAYDPYATLRASAERIRGDVSCAMRRESRHPHALAREQPCSHAGGRLTARRSRSLAFATALMCFMQHPPSAPAQLRAGAIMFVISVSCEAPTRIP